MRVLRVFRSRLSSRHLAFRYRCIPHRRVCETVSRRSMRADAPDLPSDVQIIYIRYEAVKARGPSVVAFNRVYFPVDCRWECDERNSNSRAAEALFHAQFSCDPSVTDCLSIVSEMSSICRNSSAFFRRRPFNRLDAAFDGALRNDSRLGRIVRVLVGEFNR